MESCDMMEVLAYAMVVTIPQCINVSSIMLYTLNLCSVIHQWCLNKACRANRPRA